MPLKYFGRQINSPLETPVYMSVRFPVNQFCCLASREHFIPTSRDLGFEATNHSRKLGARLKHQADANSESNLS
jgi:hypothetical protein